MRSACISLRWAEIFERNAPYYYTDEEQAVVNELFPTCENISVDYAIMGEGGNEIYVFPASFGWSDLGTWGSLHENSEKDAHNNVCIGPNIKLYESRVTVWCIPRRRRRWWFRVWMAISWLKRIIRCWFAV